MPVVKSIAMNAKEIPPSLTVITTLYNEEEALLSFYHELKEMLERTTHDYEIIFVNDGSTDKTGSLISDISRQDPHVIGIALENHASQIPAFLSAFSFISKEKTIWLDCDYTHFAKDLESLVATCSPETPVVFTWRTNRAITLLRRIGSFIINSIISFRTNIVCNDWGSSCICIQSDLLPPLLSRYGNNARFIKQILAQEHRSRLKEISIAPDTIGGRVSRYSYSSLFRLAFDMLIHLPPKETHTQPTLFSIQYVHNKKDSDHS